MDPPVGSCSYKPLLSWILNGFPKLHGDFKAESSGGPYRNADYRIFRYIRATPVYETPHAAHGNL